MARDLLPIKAVKSVQVRCFVATLTDLLMIDVGSSAQK